MIQSENINSIYPSLPDIFDEEMLAEIATLESKEKSFCYIKGSQRQQYQKAIYLKAIQYLGYSNINLFKISKQFKNRIAEELGFSDKVVYDLTIDPAEKSRILKDVKEFIGIKPFDIKAREKVENYLVKNNTFDSGDVLAIISDTINWFRKNNIELPTFDIISELTDKTIKTIDIFLQEKTFELLSQDECEKIDELLVPVNGKSPLNYFKDPILSPSQSILQKELVRYQIINSYPACPAIMGIMSRRKIEYYSNIAKKYHISELSDFKLQKRYLILLCYLAVRQSELLDGIGEVFIKIWDSTCNASKRHANLQRELQSNDREKNEVIFKGLLDIICDSKTDYDLIRSIKKLNTKNEYERIRENVNKNISWTECYYNKIKDHYNTLRRYLPVFYREIPMISTTADNSIVKAVNVLEQYSKSDITTLPVSGTPIKFLSEDWKRRAALKHRWNNKVSSIQKAPYELGVVNAIAKGFDKGTLAINGAKNYAPMTHHLLDKDYFFSNYDSYLQKYGILEEAKYFYSEIQNDLNIKLDLFDNNYKKLKKDFRINKNGSLGYSKASAQKISKDIENKATHLHSMIPDVSILELLLDCHRLTGYLNSFQPITGRQNMSQEELIYGLVTTIYAYGCNCGPTQAASATNLKKQMILYLKRHYTGTKQLTKAASVLADAYTKTYLSEKLGDPGVFMTDGMRFPTLKNSLSARHHFRYGGGKSVILYQHVTSNCICFFTKALLCDVSEAIHMLDGIMKQRSGIEPVINICDSAGKADLVFGLAKMLNIEIWPRMRSKQNLKLWTAFEESDYKNISKAIAGNVKWEYIDDGWKDIAWIIVSIIEGKATPSLIAERLSKQPNHPATRGFMELGKAERSRYLLRFGMTLETKQVVTKHTSRRETWNSFGRNVFSAYGGILKEKGLENQEEIFWFLTVVQNAIIFWNALALEQAIDKSRDNGLEISDEDLSHILPTMLNHINFVGKFDFDINRKPPFKLVA